MLPLSFTLSSLFPDFLKLVLEIARHLVVSRTRIISRLCYIPEKLVFSWFFSLQFGRFGIIIEKNMFLINIRFLFPHSRSSLQVDENENRLNPMQSIIKLFNERVERVFSFDPD